MTSRPLHYPPRGGGWPCGLAAPSASPAGAPAAAAAPAVVPSWRPRTSGATSPSQIGGHDVTVTSLITNPNADPHLFETDAADAADPGPGPGRHRERRRLRHLDELASSAPTAGTPTVVNAASVLARHGQRPQPPPLVRHPSRAHGGRRHRRRARRRPHPRTRRPSGPIWPRFDASLAPLTPRWPPSRRTSTTCRSPTPNGSPATRWPWPTSTSRPHPASPGRSRTAWIPDPRTRWPCSSSSTTRHQRAPLQRADGHARHHPDPRAGAASTASPSWASPRPCPPVSPPTSSGSSRSSTNLLHALGRAAARDRPARRAAGGRRAPRARGRCGPTWTWRCPRASSSPCSGPTAPARPPCSRCCSASSPCPPARSGSTACAPTRGNHEVGYVPQQQAFDRTLPIRGRDLVRFGVDGHRWGLPLPQPRRRGAGSTPSLDAVGAIGLRRRPGRPALGRRAATAAHRPGAARRPHGPACATSRCSPSTWPASAP